MKKPAIIYSRAPARFDFSGGPTDVEPFSSKEGGIVVNVAIGLYAQVRLEPRKDQKISICSYDLGVKKEYRSINELSIDGPLKLIQATILYVKPDHGFSIEAKCDAPPGSGLGSSAAVAVALIAALRAFNGYQVPDTELIVNGSLEVENKLLENINGGQDQYASSFGGFNYLEWKNGKVKRVPINVSRRSVLTLEERAVLCYSGSTRVSGDVLTRVMSRYVSGDIKVIESLRAIRQTAGDARRTLLNGDISALGILLSKNYIAQSKLYKQINTADINKIFRLGKRNGIIGGKIAGAGGGGCVLLICEPFFSQRLKKELITNKFLVLPFTCEKNGVEVWFEKD
jgi:D-glycero-alpha-D-manno-heptose-7-phosphate kinase